MTKKGREFDTMPFFLSDEFKSILDEKLKGTGGMADGRTDSLGDTLTSGSGVGA